MTVVVEQYTLILQAQSRVADEVSLETAITQ